MHEYLSTIFQLIFVFQRYFSPIIMCTSSQNGVAECKIQHLVETACNLVTPTCPFVFGAMSFSLHVTSSIVLQNQLPYSVLFPKQDLYSLLLHVFGCACLVHDLTLGKNKLVATLFKCLPPSHSWLQGCHCYHPNLCQYLVYTDINFFLKPSFFPSYFESLSCTQWHVSSYSFFSCSCCHRYLGSSLAYISKKIKPTTCWSPYHSYFYSSCTWGLISDFVGLSCSASCIDTTHNFTRRNRVFSKP